MTTVPDFSLGVEEEFFLVDAETGALVPGVDRVLAAAGPEDPHDLEPELQRWQVETATPICTTLAEVRAELLGLRAHLRAAAETLGYRVVATGTHPLATSADAAITPKPRYLHMAEEFGELARDQLVCGCHVHVGIADRELAVQAMNRTRLWSAAMVALAANSPYWKGTDSGYASYRSQVWTSWPTAGPPEVFASRAEYDAVVGSLVSSGAIPDLGMVYLDVRPSRTFATLEFRATDVCLAVDDAVLVAGLSRALARTAAESALREEPLPAVRAELLRAAAWRAARSGLDGQLIDVLSGRAVPATELLRGLVTHVRPALEAHGDLDEVEALLAQVVGRGTGAARQRAAFRRRGRLEDVAQLLAEETVREA